MSLDKALNWLLYASGQPRGVSWPRWKAMKKHLMREYLGFGDDE